MCYRESFAYVVRELPAMFCLHCTCSPQAAEGEERSPRGRDISPTSHLRTADLRVRHFTPPPMSTVHPSAISGRIAAQHLPTNEYRQPSIPSDGMHIRVSRVCFFPD